MSKHQSLIDDALSRARVRMSAGSLPTDKIASARGLLIKEAEEVANALEYVSLGIVNDGSAVGSARASMIRDFLVKSAAESADAPASGATSTVGMQGQVPAQSKKKLQPGGSPSAVNPEASAAMDGRQPENILRQMPAAVTAPVADKAANLSLYDVLMNNKVAASGGAAEMDAEQSAPGMVGGGDGKRFADAIFKDNAAPVSASKRDAKLPTRARLAEVWGHANDTTGQQSAQAVFPQAASKGELKVASLARAFQQETLKEAEEEKSPGKLTIEERANKLKEQANKLTSRQRAAAGAALGAGLTPIFKGTGGAVGAAYGAAPGKKGLSALGGLAGGFLGSIPGSFMPSFPLAIGARMAGGAAGAGLGAYLAHGEDDEGKKASVEAVNTLGDYSELFDLALEGQLGEELQTWAQGIESR